MWLRGFDLFAQKGGAAMTIPDGQIWMLHHVGTAYYWTRWLDAPLRDDRVEVMGLPCRVVAVVDDACGESKVFVERV